MRYPLNTTHGQNTKEALFRSHSLRLCFIFSQVKTSKYNIINFLPKNLWEQFQRVANVYFLLISLLQARIQYCISNKSSSLLSVTNTLPHSLLFCFRFLSPMRRQLASTTRL